ncbi:AraC family transcriptional regulator [Spongiibacter taiwanensis]|uniref:AraC family transcriptional regulator n=1 Tax=Spongiibacter taiwanensis TaxID=1748242 RepID=UPI002035C501|nr:AraC family transcriptional regulator [Spongiibacter taiwanensis]USA44423.1 AraC family transcriptional regulator [Spongiibacter taiwanensis]
MNPAFASAGQGLIPAWLQGLAVLDLCAARGVELESLLPGTGIFIEDLPLADRHLSATQFQRLLENAQRRWPGGDFGFQLGHALAHHGLGPLADYLATLPVSDWGQALSRYQLLIAPGLWLYCAGLSPDTLLVQFSPASSSPDHISACALITVLHRLLKSRADARVEEVFFSGRSGLAEEQCLAHWGKLPNDAAPFDGLMITFKAKPCSDEWAVSPQHLRRQLAKSQCEALLPPLPGLPMALRNQLLVNNGSQANLLQCASALQVSPATLKRRLQEQGLHFQALLDDCLRQRAVAELLRKGSTIEGISEQLSFHDSSNFRRAFKRWTGTTPSQMRLAFKTLIY